MRKAPGMAVSRVARRSPWVVANREKLARVNRSRLARECAKLDPKDEKAFAEEGLLQ